MPFSWRTVASEALQNLDGKYIFAIHAINLTVLHNTQRNFFHDSSDTLVDDDLKKVFKVASFTRF